MENKSVVILIPSYRPSDKLQTLIKSLVDLMPDTPIVLVNDGSGPDFDNIFESSSNYSQVSLVNHAVNIGKGGALKTGINHILVHFPGVHSIVTADGDGQHHPVDISRIVNEAQSKPGHFILGARSFGNDIPLRSRFGNQVSKVVYRFLLGLKLQDTQTGLRALPKELAELTLGLKANRYELETEQLILVSDNRLPITQIPIKTIYEDNNSSSHFNPFFDSIQIYFSLLRYTITSILSALADLILFVIICTFSSDIILNNLSSRYLAMFIQFILLKKFVFNAKAGFSKLVLFILLVTATGLISGVLQVELQEQLSLNYVLAKVIVDSTLFIFNFLFLRDILFKKR